MDLGKCEETAYLGGGDFSLGEPEADVSLLNLYVLPKGKNISGSIPGIYYLKKSYTIYYVK